MGYLCLKLKGAKNEYRRTNQNFSSTKISTISEKMTLESMIFWNGHLKYVYDETIDLANKYGADLEIVQWGGGHYYMILHRLRKVRKRP